VNILFQLSASSKEVNLGLQDVSEKDETDWSEDKVNYFSQSPLVENKMNAWKEAAKLHFSFLNAYAMAYPFQLAKWNPQNLPNLTIPFASLRKTHLPHL
jgi:hypothetical protein